MGVEEKKYTKVKMRKEKIWLVEDENENKILTKHTKIKANKEEINKKKRKDWN